MEVLRSGISPELEMDLPPLSCGGNIGFIALPIDEYESAAGQVLLIGGVYSYGEVISVVALDLATGACTRQSPLLYSRYDFAGGRLPDGRIVCAGGMRGDVIGEQEPCMSPEVMEPPEEGSPDGLWS